MTPNDHRASRRRRNTVTITSVATIAGACAEPVLLREARRVLEEGNASLVWLGQPEDLEKMHVPEGVMTIPISCQSDGALQIFIEPVMAAPHVVIVGRSPMAVTLLDLVRDLGWRGDLIDAIPYKGVRCCAVP